MKLYVASAPTRPMLERPSSALEVPGRTVMFGTAIERFSVNGPLRLAGLERVSVERTVSWAP